MDTDYVPGRTPVQFSTYPGDARGILTEGPKGPNTIGEYLYPVTAEYDSSADQTRVGFSYIAPPVEEQTWTRWEHRPTPFGVGVFPVEVSGD